MGQACPAQANQGAKVCYSGAPFERQVTAAVESFCPRHQRFGAQVAWAGYTPKMMGLTFIHTNLLESIYFLPLNIIHISKSLHFCLHIGNTESSPARVSHPLSEFVH